MNKSGAYAADIMLPGNNCRPPNAGSVLDFLNSRLAGQLPLALGHQVVDDAEDQQGTGQEDLGIEVVVA